MKARKETIDDIVSPSLRRLVAWYICSKHIVRNTDLRDRTYIESANAMLLRTGDGQPGGSAAGMAEGQRDRPYGGPFNAPDQQITHSAVRTEFGSILNTIRELSSIIDRGRGPGRVVLYDVGNSDAICLAQQRLHALYHARSTTTNEPHRCWCIAGTLYIECVLRNLNLRAATIRRSSHALEKLCIGCRHTSQNDMASKDSAIWLWTLTLGGITSGSDFFVESLAAVCSSMQLLYWNDVERVLEQLCWPKSKFSAAGRRLWEKMLGDTAPLLPAATD